MFAPVKQTTLNGFPRYSIVIYDDPNFLYKRQSINGKQVMSNIISDDYYAFSPSNTDRVNYILGQNSQNKIYYIKILVHKQIIEDTVGQISNVLVLSKTQTLGKSSTKYYGITCIEKNQLYTSYSTSISIISSDFINQSDGLVYLTLVGDYSVTYNYPLNLTITNNAPTTIPQQSTTVTPTIAVFPNNYSQYFKTSSTAFGLFEYSNTFDYNFTSQSLVLNTILFNTTTTGVFITGNTGSLIRLTPSNLSTIFNEQYFGVTISNTDATYSPSRDTYFYLIIRTKGGAIIKTEPSKILNNNVSGYYNVIFNFKNTIIGVDYLDYVLLEVKTRSTSTITTPYQISYMSFITPADSSFKVFSVKSINESYCLTPFGDQIYFDDIKKNTLIKTSNFFSTVESLILVNDEIIYEITTQMSVIRLPENAMIKTDQDFLPVYSLTKSNTVYYNDSLISIEALRIMPPSECTLVDTYEDSDYSYNGFYVKNPLYLKNFQKHFLGIINKSNYIKNVNIDGVDYPAELCDQYYTLNNIHLEPFTVHNITFHPDSTKVVIFYNGASDITVKNNNITDVIQKLKYCVCKLDSSHTIEIKSNSSVEIIKMLIK